MLGISIHSLRMEGDHTALLFWRSMAYFNPLPPHGGRPCNLITDDQMRIISIHSLRMEGDRTWERSEWNRGGISIHSLRMEGDRGRFRRIGIVTKYFNPLPPHGGRLACPQNNLTDAIFQSTPSAWRETNVCIPTSVQIRNFNPLPPHGGRQTQTLDISENMLFQSTPSAWRETWNSRRRSVGCRHFNPLPPHGGRRQGSSRCTAPNPHFNPLPPHGGRHHFQIIVNLVSGISIHSLRMEGDWEIPADWNCHEIFQSTPSAWRETSYNWIFCKIQRNFNPLPPHGGRPQLRGTTSGDWLFQSTPSAWRETRGFRTMTGKRFISIHSLRMEGDLISVQKLQPISVFQSTPSAWRETFISGSTGRSHPAFQSTPSAWRETQELVVSYVHMDYFNPLPPHGGRL